MKSAGDIFHELRIRERPSRNGTFVTVDNMTRIYGGVWSARIVYRWRSRQHLRRWLKRGERWRGVPGEQAAA